MDALAVGRPRADLQFQILAEALKPLEIPVYSILGNHDVFGWSDRAEDAADMLYGKKMIEERVLKGPSYRSFDRDGYHFVLLDSLLPSAPDQNRTWYGGIDDEQLTWLSNDLEKAGNTPSIVVTHIPVMTLFSQYTDGTTVATSDALILRNGREVQAILAKHNVPLVLQGHTHVVEDCSYLGTRYITGGAVCGDWWKGWRLGVHPEGFMVYDLDGKTIKAEYVASGWKARTS
jgi:3',5'-cyclic AMP phosphodiesterase CpdA